jgi:hypothetical protein
MNTSEQELDELAMNTPPHGQSVMATGIVCLTWTEPGENEKRKSTQPIHPRISQMTKWIATGLGDM